MQPDTVHSYRPDNTYSTWWIYFCVSLALHITVFVIIIVMPAGTYMETRMDQDQTVDVSLVSINPEIPNPSSDETPSPSEPAQAVQTPEETDEPAETETREPEPLPVKSGVQKNFDTSDYALKLPETDKKAAPEKEPEVKKPEIKESLKKKTFESAKAIDEAVKRIEEKTRSSRPRTLESRIEEMKKKVGDTTYQGSGTEKESDTETASTGSSAGRGGFSQMQIYQAEVAVSMKRNWAFSEELAGNTKGLESRLIIKILPDGQITDVWYEKRSGNPYLDESAYKTVMKSNPLPPLPDSYSKPYYHLVLGFTPSGLK